MAVKLYDENRNMYNGGESHRIPEFTFDCEELQLSAVQGGVPRWESPQHDTHQLRLPPMLLQPRTIPLPFGARPNMALECTVTLSFRGLLQKQPDSEPVSTTFKVSVWPGETGVVCCMRMATQASTCPSAGICTSNTNHILVIAIRTVLLFQPVTMPAVQKSVSVWLSQHCVTLCRLIINCGVCRRAQRSAVYDAA